MKVRKEQHDHELQAHWQSGRAVAKLTASRWGLKLMHRMAMGPLMGRKIKEVRNEEVFIEDSFDPGNRIRVRIFKPANSSGVLPAMLYLHAGGYSIGCPERHLRFFKDLLERRDIAIIAPAYRLSLEAPFPAGFNDAYGTLRWMKANAQKLGIRPDCFMVAGHSAGGGLTAAVSLKARDTGDADIAFQMPLYPMLDHRMVTESSKLENSLVWDATSNKLGWELYLEGQSPQEISPYASPSICTDLSNLPPTISFVGDLEPFRDETLAYLEGLKRAGTEITFKLFNGAFHGFENVAPKTTISKAANAFQLDAFEAYFDRFIQH